MSNKLLHGFSKSQIDRISKSRLASLYEFIHTTDGEYFIKSNHRIPDLGLPGYRLVTATFPNGNTEPAWINPCNGNAHLTIGSHIH